jgi:diguanylate cyclase (GGDEF)-like protein
MEKQEQVEHRLRALRQAFAESLPQRLAEVSSCWRALAAAPGAATGEAFHRCVHSLRGTGPSFGFHRLGEVTGRLATLMKCCKTAETLLEPENRAQVERLLLELQEASVLAGEPFAALPNATTIRDKGGLGVVIVEDDGSLGEDLSLHLRYYGYQTRLFSSPAEALQAILSTPPALVVLDIMFAEGVNAGLDLATQVHRHLGDLVPILIVSVRADFEARLRAVRAGVGAYLVKPVDMAALIEKVDELCGIGDGEPFRILIVEDSQSLAFFYATILEQAGFLTQVVNDPLTALEKIGDFHPELILMDLYMPGCTGLELAAVIRQQEAYHGIPIVFLSSELSPERQFAAMQSGGDDFLTKPIAATHLVNVCRLRAGRARETQRLITSDSLTGLLNHTSGKERLDAELARARRDDKVISVVMLDIDLFKGINDSYGHPTGDRVIKTLARLLRQRLRASDTLCRYGGEEFLLILPGTPKETAGPLLEQIRQDFSTLRHQYRETYFNATLSAGICDSATEPEATALLDAADAALYRAKRSGRNRVVLG